MGELGIQAKQGWNVIVNVHSRDYQTATKKVTKLALLGYIRKDELQKWFKCVPQHTGYGGEG